MQVDFHQLGGAELGEAIAGIAEELLAQDSRLLVVAGDETLLAKLDRLLWDRGPASFLPHGLAGGADDSRQPILLSTSPDAPNLARNMLIADGQWREAALSYDRAFYLFDDSVLEGARLAWKLLSGREAVERHFRVRDESGRWVEKA